MKTRIVLLCVALLVVCACAAQAATTVATWGNSWLEDIGDGRPDLILHLNESTPYLNGYAQGAMLATQVAQVTRAYLQYGLNNGFTQADGVALWNQQLPWTNQAYVDEIQGIADAAGVSVDDLHAVHAFPSRFSCCGFGAHNAATPDGKTVMGRSLDYPTDIQDPVSGKYIQENGLITIYHGDGLGLVSWAGFAGSVGGTRIGQLAVAEQTEKIGGWATFDGKNMAFAIRDALMAPTAQDAAVVLVTNPTKGYSFQTGDLSSIRCIEVAGPQAYYIGDENGQEFHNSHFWYIADAQPIPNCVRRTNCFCSSQCLPYQSPGEGWELHLSFLQSRLSSQANNHNVTASVASDILAGTYTDMLGLPELVTTSEHQWSVKLETGEMWVRRSTPSQSAYRATRYQYNLAAELAETPPGQQHVVSWTTAPWGTPTTLTWTGGTVACHALAACSLGDNITYQWTASANGASFTAPTSPDTNWTAPQNKGKRAVVHTLTCTATDAAGNSISGSFTVTVNKR